MDVSGYMNLYVHFPFCRAKCAYCALHSHAGSTPEARRAYCSRLAAEIATWGTLPRIPGTDPEKVGTVPQKEGSVPHFSTIYFGGGSPALCDLTPIFHALHELGTDSGKMGSVPQKPTGTVPKNPGTAPGKWGTVPEFTVELHPLDARPEVLEMLKKGGVNRVSMGVQSLDDDVLKAMGRLHTAAEAAAAFRAVRAAGFTNAGIDLIAGWPGTTPDSWRTTLARATALGLDHCSVYTLIREPKTRLDLALRRGELALPSDDAALAQIDVARAALAEAGLVRYEISNYARPSFECRHNLAVWRGEDYVGLGDGAHGRVGLVRTASGVETTVTPEEDAVERALFSLRTREGLSLERIARLWPILVPRLSAWRETLEFFKRQGLLQDAYRLTPRGAEVCDSILAELV